MMLDDLERLSGRYGGHEVLALVKLHWGKLRLPLLTLEASRNLVWRQGDYPRLRAYIYAWLVAYE